MSTDKDSLGDRMKWYETRYTNDVFMPMVPVLARLDGRSFHNFTKGLKRPFDSGLSQLMIETTKYLVQETNARCGYTQSDEITLAWLAEEWESDIFFSAKLQKMNSVLASMTSVFFNKFLKDFIPDKSGEIPLFDCRVFQVPADFEAVNCFIWREQDATRNSVQMAARAFFSHNECNDKSCSELQEMLWSQKGVNWNDYPVSFKRGTYVRRRNIERDFTPEEIASLPEKHAYRRDPTLKIKRTVVMQEELPILSRIKNRDEVILYGADPITKECEDDSRELA